MISGKIGKMTKIYVANDGTEFSSKEQVIEYHELKSSEDKEFADQRLIYLGLNAASNHALNNLLEFREKCEHKYVKIESHSDTGNWCKSDDSYWYSIECKCCDKRWREDQSTSQYRRSNDKNIEWIKK